MSKFSDQYFKLMEEDEEEKKKKKKKTETKVETKSSGDSFSDEYNRLIGSAPTTQDYIHSFNGALDALKTETKMENAFGGNRTTKSVFSGEKEEDRKWFQKGAFEDGYQFGDVTKTILGTVTDTAENVGAGIIGMGEKVVDTLATIAPYVAQGQFYQNGGAYQNLTTQKMFNEQIERDKETMAEFVKKDLYDEEKVAKFIISNPVEHLTGIDAEEDSVFGEKTDALAQSGGQLLATAGLQAVGVPWFVTTGVTSFGGEAENAFNQGATNEEAVVSAAISAGAEILTEKLSGGISFGGKTLDDFAVNRLSRAISNKTLRAMAKFGLDAVGEGGEEVVSQVFSNLGSSLYKEESLGELLASEEAIDEYIESFIGGAVLGGVSSGINTVKSNAQGVDAVTGLTENEQKVIDKVYKDAVAEAEQDGKKLTQKEKDKLYEATLDQMDKGYISTDTIEEVLGGETFKTYKETIDNEDALQEEFNTLNKMKQGDMTGEQVDRRAELKAQLEELKTKSQRGTLKTQLGDEVFGMVQSDRLVESYNERGRRGQAFEADLTQYDSKAQETIKKAIDSGILNNTNRTHEFVDLIAKISADKGVPFDFTNNQRLKDSGFAVEGKQVNGFVHNGNITLNIDSAKALQSTVGHEVTHVLEGTELYDALSQTVIEYAKSKGDYQGRYDTLSKLYDGVEGANIDAELTADLVGDYLFSDTDFVKNLSVQNRNVFQKIWDEVKYLAKVATAGSKEARELARVQKAFEDAYRESGKGAEGTKYSISDKNIKDVSTGYASGETYFTMSYTQDGKVVGTIEYGEYDGNPNVKMIEVDPEYRRKGIATKLLQELQKKYPDTEIDFGMSTPDGTKLLESITYDVTDEAVVADRQKLKDLQTELNELQEKLDVLYDTDNLTEAQEAELDKLGDRWTEVYDTIRELEQSLRGKRATKTFVKTDTKYSLSDSDGKQLTKEQQDYFKDSKMRDADGNLMVMYHGSQDAGFHVFDSDFSDDGTSFFFVDRNDVSASYSGTTETYEARAFHTAEDFNKFFAEIGKEEYSVKEEGHGKYRWFVLYEGGTEIASAETAEMLYDEFRDWEGVGYGDANYKVYLNLTNPLEVDAGGRNWNNISREFSQEVYDRYKSLTAEEKDALTDVAEWGEYGVFKDEMLSAAKSPDFAPVLASAYEKLGGANANLYDAFTIASDNFSEDSLREFAVKQMNTREYAKKAKSEGYDGVIFKNIHDNGGYSNGSEGASTVAIAFDSNQIKSVANEKPTADKDIRYSLSDPETDKNYLDAVKRGDAETAQRMVLDAGKETGYAVRAYHGTARGDRVGNVFLPERATSGPMAFFTDDKQIAENYSKSKQDTSMAYDPDFYRYETQFRIKTKNNDMPLYRAWGYLPFDARNRITKKAGQLREDWDGDGELMLDPDTNEANGGFQWQLKESRGNAIQALIEQWLNSGNLFNEESRFLDVLEMTGVTEEFRKIGMDSLYFKDPNAKHEKVYDTLLKINNPFDTANVDEQFIADLESWYEEQDQDQYVRENMESDMWDKNGIDAYDFAERLRSDLENNTTHAWTSIPDSVTDYLKSLGHDGIKDAGGKYSGIGHTVWIPFSSEQVKSAEPVTYDDSGNVIPLSERFNPQEKDIRRSLSFKDEAPVRRRRSDIYGSDVRLETVAPVQDSAQVPVQETVEEPMFPDDLAPVEYDAEQFDSLTDTDAPPEMEAPYYESQPVTVDDPMEGRFPEDMGKRSIKAYMYENPEVKPFFQQEARAMLGELINTTKGERTYADVDYMNEYGYTSHGVWSGTKRHTSDDIAYLLDKYHYTYDQIEKGLKAIIEDNGAENNAVSKRIEFILNDRLIDGYTDFYYGEEVPPNQDYINLINEKQITEYSKEAFDALMANADEYAPISEEMVPETVTYDAVAPVKEAYEAIRPKKEKEPKLAKATPQEQARAQILTEEPKVDKKKPGAWNLFKDNIVDKGTVFETLSLKTGNRELQARWKSIGRAESRAQWFMEHGNAETSSLKSIRETVEKSGKTQEFSEYLYHQHNVDRMNLADRYEGMENKPVFGYSVTSKMSKEEAAKLEKANPEFKEWANEVYTYMTTLREMMVDNGVISRETANLWAEMYPHYVPVRRKGDEGLNINVALDTKRTGVNAPVKKATGGNRDILPLFDTMAMRTEQTFKANARNRFGVELKNLIAPYVETEAMDIDEAIYSVENEELLQEGKDGKNPTFTVFENGEKVTFEITDEMYDTMKPKSKAMSYTNKVLNTLNNIRRGLLTEYNPAFMLTNPIKDTQDVMINSQHPARTYANYPKAISELLGKGQYYQEYMENGGEMNTYFDDDTKTFTPEKSGLSKVIGFPLEKISQANNFIERVPRMAEYIASRKEGRSIDVSMLDAARVTTDFSAGGDLVKFMNRNGFTFLNASVQGAVQQVRNVREAKAEGVKGWAKLAAKVAVAGLPSILLNHLLWDDDEEYAELSDYVKQNYYIVAKYGDGKFVRIPKGRALAVIQNAFEQMENLVTGNDDVDLDAFGELVLSNLAPSNPLENNLIAPISQAMKNTTWYGDDMVPTRLQDLPAEEQFDETTDSISKWLGEKLNISPYKINYVLDQYSGAIGDMLLPMITPEAERGNDTLLGNMIAPITDKFTTDSVMKNQNVSDFYDTKGKLNTNAKGSGATEEDVLMNKYMNSINDELSDLYAEKRKIQNSDLSNAEKYEAVRNIQKQIVDLTREGLATYDDIDYQTARDGEYVNIGNRYFKQDEEGEWNKLSDDQVTKYKVTSEAGDSNYATDGEVHYRWYEAEDGEEGWRKISDKELERQTEITDGLGITPEAYWNNKEEYTYAFDYPENYAVSKAVGGYESFRTYTSELYDISADKDKYGKSITGSRKEKVVDYINNLDADYYTKLILFKYEYNSDDSHNMEIINYLNGREDISFEEEIVILRKLGFEVDSKGNISW